MSTYGLPGHGLLARTVTRNSKCERCLHFESQKGLTGVCTISLQPAGCGDGDYPTMGFAPVDRAGPDADANGLVEPLGSAPHHEEALKAIVAQLAEESRYGCVMHSQSSDLFRGETCSCLGVKSKDVADALWLSLHNRTRAVTTREQLEAYVEKTMESVYAPPGAAKRPPRVYLPGVHSPDSPVRQLRGLKKKAAEPAVAAKSVEDGIAELEALFSKGPGDPRTHTLLSGSGHGGSVSRKLDEPSPHPRSYKDPQHQKWGKIAEEHGAGHHVDGEGRFHLHTSYSDAQGGGTHREHITSTRHLMEHLGY